MVQDSMPKVIQVCAIGYSVKKQLELLIDKSIERDYETIIVCSEGKDTHKIEESKGYKFRYVEIDRNINLIKNTRTLINLIKVFKEEKPDIVHVHTPIAGVLGRIAAKIAGIKIVVYTAHGFYFHENMKPAIYKIFYLIEKYVGRFCTDYIFTQSIEDSEVAIKGKFLLKENIMPIGNGVDISGKFNLETVKGEEIEVLKSEFNIKREDTVITFIGRLVREKGIIDLLKAFVVMERDDVKLLIIGDRFKGERDSYCEEELRRYKEEKNIFFIGDRVDINNLLAITDIFCLPSYREGMPRSIIEAMAMECAVIATNIRGSREEVLNDETGYLIDINSPIQIKEKIEALINNKEKLEYMKKRGRKRAEELYDETLVVERQLTIFQELLNNKRGDDNEVQKSR